MLVDCGFTAITKQGKGSQSLAAMIAPVENHPELMLSNMTQVRQASDNYLLTSLSLGL